MGIIRHILRSKVLSKHHMSASYLFAWVFVLLFASHVSAATISEGYSAEQPLLSGTLVSLDDSNPKKITPTGIGNFKRVVGVVVGLEEGLLAIQGEQTNIQVATSGEATILVNDLGGGEIKAGDSLKLSRVKGMVERAPDENSRYIVGAAVDSLSFDTAAISSSSVVSDESVQTVRVGKIKVQLLENIAEQSSQGGIGAALISVGERVVGREVSLVQVVLAMILFTISLVISTVLVYGAIHGSFVSIGRNPLASSHIFKNLRNSSIVAFLVIAGGFGAAYLLLLI